MSSLKNVLYIAALAWPVSSWADVMEFAGTPSDGLAAYLSCQMLDLFQSYVGLLIGLLFGVLGLWQIIKKSALKTGLITIMAGALITAIPTLIISFFAGLSEFLNNAEISEVSSDVPIRAINETSCEDIRVDLSVYDSSTPEGQRNSARAGLANGIARDTGGMRINPMTPEQVAALPDASDVSSSGGCANILNGHGRMTSRFGQRGGRPHKGIDYGVPIGTPIFAAGGGKVVDSRLQNGWGNFVRIDHGGGKYTLYAHMDRPGLPNGTQVSAGQQIGVSGNSGRSTGPHLHFEVWNGIMNQVDPATSEFCNGGGSST